MAYRLVFIAGYLDRNCRHFQTKNCMRRVRRFLLQVSIRSTKRIVTLPQSTEMPR